MAFVCCFALVGVFATSQPVYAAEESYPNNVTVNNGVQLSGAAFFKNGDTGTLTGTATDYNARYDSTTGILELKNYVGGTIATTGNTGKTTIIKLSGTNTITDSRFGITAFGGDSVVITSDDNATLNIAVNGISSYNQTIAGISAYNPGNPTGSVTVKGNVNLIINVTAGSTDATENAIGIYAANEIKIEENASINVKCVNETNSSTTNVGLFTENGSNQRVTFNTNGNISIDASESNGYSFAIRSSNYTMTKANLITLKWNPGSANNGGEIYGSDGAFNTSNWAINIDKTNHVATYKYGTPYTVNVFGGRTNMSNGKYVEGETVNLTAYQSYVDAFGFKKWTSNGVTITNDTNATSSFVMPENDVNVFAYYDIFTTEPAFTRTSNNSGKITYVLKQEPSQVKWFNINGEQIDTFGNATNASHDIGTFRTPAGTYYIEFTIDGGTYRSEPISVDYTIPHTHNHNSEWSKNETNHWHECECGDKKDIAGHTYGEWVEITPATASSEGLKKKTCSVCGYEENTTIPKIGHTHNWSTDWTHDENQHWHACVDSECSEKNAVASHVYDKQVISDEYKATNATHTAKATYYYSCVCGAKGNTTFANGETVPHNHASEWSKNETHHWHECECGDKSGYAEHVYNKQVANDTYLATEATCTQKATYYYSCECGAKGTETFVGIGYGSHEYSTEWSNNDTHHWHACACGDKKDNATHVYDNACDTTCNTCGHERTITHTYDNDCDTDCNVCGETRTTTHTYDNACDTTCNVCGETRTTTHTYDNACDTTCNVCGETRTVGGHVYENDDDADCNECGHTRKIVKVTNGTKVENADGTVTITANTAPEGKQFKGWQNSEGEIVSTEMTYTVNANAELTAVYEDKPTTPVVNPTKNDGLSGGAIAGIVIGSAVVLSLGGFAIFWFAIKKKSFADLIAAIKAIFKK